MSMEIKTNHNWRPVLLGYELSEKERSEFDWIDPDEIDGYSFVKYKGYVYSLDQFMRVDHYIPGNWDGIRHDSFFSGVLIKLSECGEAYQIATYCS